MCCVDDFSQFLSINHFFKYPHIHSLVKLVKFHDIATNYFRYCRAPIKIECIYFKQWYIYNRLGSSSPIKSFATNNYWFQYTASWFSCLEIDLSLLTMQRTLHHQHRLVSWFNPKTLPSGPLDCSAQSLSQTVIHFCHLSYIGIIW